MRLWVILVTQILMEEAMFEILAEKAGKARRNYFTPDDDLRSFTRLGGLLSKKRQLVPELVFLSEDRQRHAEQNFRSVFGFRR